MNLKQKIELLKNTTYFSGVSDEEIRCLAKNTVIKKYQEDQQVYKKDDQSFVYILTKGKVKITSPQKGKNEMIYELIYPGDLFGAIHCSSSNNIHLKTAQSYHSEVECLQISYKEYYSFLERNLIISQRVIEFLLKRMMYIENRMKTFISEKASKRVIGFLKHRAKDGIRIGNSETLIHIKLTNQEIANYTDTSRQTVAKVFQELKGKNQIHVTLRNAQKNILIRNLVDLS